MLSHSKIKKLLASGDNSPVGSRRSSYDFGSSTLDSRFDTSANIDTIDTDEPDSPSQLPDSPSQLSVRSSASSIDDSAAPLSPRIDTGSPSPSVEAHWLKLSEVQHASDDQSSKIAAHRASLNAAQAEYERSIENVGKHRAALTRVAEVGDAQVKMIGEHRRLLNDALDQYNNPELGSTSAPHHKRSASLPSPREMVGSSFAGAAERIRRYTKMVHGMGPACQSLGLLQYRDPSVYAAASRADSTEQYRPSQITPFATTRS